MCDLKSKNKTNIFLLLTKITFLKEYMIHKKISYSYFFLDDKEESKSTDALLSTPSLHPGMTDVLLLDIYDAKL